MISRLHRRELLLALGLMLILGGALGNLTDRLIHGYVIDFIDMYYRAWHWPAFNVADSAITVGAVFLVIDALGLYGRGKS
jgi:signal peptidase II